RPPSARRSAERCTCRLDAAVAGGASPQSSSDSRANETARPDSSTSSASSALGLGPPIPSVLSPSTTSTVPRTRKSISRGKRRGWLRAFGALLVAGGIIAFAMAVQHSQRSPHGRELLDCVVDAWTRAEHDADAGEIRRLLADDAVLVVVGLAYADLH